MLEDYNTPRMRALLYALIVLSSLAVFGNVAELCDIANKCPTRLAVVIAIGVLATIISGVLFIGTMFHMDLLLLLETKLCVLLLVALSVCAGLVSSFRTNLQETIALSFSWVGLALAVIVAFLSVTCENYAANEKRIKRRGRTLDAGEGAPECNYMEEMDDSSAPERSGANDQGPVEAVAAAEEQTNTSS